MEGLAFEGAAVLGSEQSRGGKGLATGSSSGVASVLSAG